MTGVLTKVAYQNPHSYVFINAANANGQVEELTFQLSSTTNLKRGGADRPTLMRNVGKTVTDFCTDNENIDQLRKLNAIETAKGK